MIANLELMPERMNSGKGASVGQRQHDLGRKLNKAGDGSVKCVYDSVLLGEVRADGWAAAHPRRIGMTNFFGVGPNLTYPSLYISRRDESYSAMNVAPARVTVLKVQSLRPVDSCWSPPNAEGFSYTAWIVVAQSNPLC